MDAEPETTPQSEPSAEEIAAAPEISEGASFGAQVGGPEVAAANESAGGSDASGPKVTVGFPHDHFDSGVKGVKQIGNRTPVDKSKLKAVKDAAKAAGVRLVVED